MKPCPTGQELNMLNCRNEIEINMNSVSYELQWDYDFLIRLHISVIEKIITIIGQRLKTSTHLVVKLISIHMETTCWGHKPVVKFSNCFSKYSVSVLYIYLNLVYPIKVLAIGDI